MSAIDLVWEYLAVALGILVIVRASPSACCAGAVVGPRGCRRPRRATPGRPGRRHRQPRRRGGRDRPLGHPSDVAVEPELEAAPAGQRPRRSSEGAAGRPRRLRPTGALNTALGKGPPHPAVGRHLDEDTWEESRTPCSPPTSASPPTQELVDRLRERVKVLGTRTPEELRTLLREELVTLVGRDMDRVVKTEPE